MTQSPYTPYIAHKGNSPLVISAPHIGLNVPDDIFSRLNTQGQNLTETDFNVHRLYDFAQNLGASTLWAEYSRYVIDLNRDPDSAPLYPGQFETGLCPLSDFDAHPLYQLGCEPDQDEINDRRIRFWQPYHNRLESLLLEAQQTHGYALLIDAHSIRPVIPSLFEGRLPDLNFGTHIGKSCGSFINDAISHFMEKTPEFSSVLNGRFKGGYTTRHYGRPHEHIHAVQIEIVQDIYLDMNNPRSFDPIRAQDLSQALNTLIASLLSTLKSVY